MDIIKFNKKIYNLPAVEKAALEYKDFANFDIKDSGAYLEVAITSKNQEMKNLSLEFTNFVLGLMS